MLACSAALPISSSSPKRPTISLSPFFLSHHHGKQNARLLSQSTRLCTRSLSLSSRSSYPITSSPFAEASPSSYSPTHHHHPTRRSRLACALSSVLCVLFSTHTYSLTHSLLTLTHTYALARSTPHTSEPLLLLFSLLENATLK